LIGRIAAVAVGLLLPTVEGIMNGAYGQ